MFKWLKKLFEFRKRKPAVGAVEVVAPAGAVEVVAPGSREPIVSPPPSPRIPMSEAMRARRASRLSRLKAISDPPAWVRSEIEELEREN